MFIAGPVLRVQEWNSEVTVELKLGTRVSVDGVEFIVTSLQTTKDLNGVRISILAGEELLVEAARQQAEQQRELVRESIKHLREAH